MLEGFGLCYETDMITLDLDYEGFFNSEQIISATLTDNVDKVIKVDKFNHLNVRSTHLFRV
jgi:hypothetical protein